MIVHSVLQAVICYKLIFRHSHRILRKTTKYPLPICDIHTKSRTEYMNFRRVNATRSTWTPLIFVIGCVRPGKVPDISIQTSRDGFAADMKGFWLHTDGTMQCAHRNKAK